MGGGVAAQLALVRRRREHLALVHDHAPIGTSSCSSARSASRSASLMKYSSRGKKRGAHAPDHQPAARVALGKAQRAEQADPAGQAHARWPPATAASGAASEKARSSISSWYQAIVSRSVRSSGARPVAELAARLARRVAPVLGHQQPALRRDRRRQSELLDPRGPARRPRAAAPCSGCCTPDRRGHPLDQLHPAQVVAAEHVALAGPARAPRRAGGRRPRRARRPRSSRSPLPRAAGPAGSCRSAGSRSRRGGCDPRRRRST